MVEYDLSFLVCFSEAGGGQCVFLFLSKFLEEGEHLQKLFVLLLVLLVYIVHHLLEDVAVDLDEFAVSECQHRG